MLIMLLEIIGCSSTRFSNSFKKLNKGKYKIEVPEVQEVLLVAIALTQRGMDDQNMVNHKTAYYQSVLEYFRKYTDHPLVQKLNTITQDYTRLKMDACGFYFDENNHIRKNKTYKRLNWSRKNYVTPILTELQDFATKSDFRSFYLANKTLYDREVQLFKKQTQVEKQWQWLESRFTHRYDNYWFTFSPLVSGIHSTNKFSNRGFKQSVMFVKGPIKEKHWSEELNAAHTSRIVFTEIDHNYVNPVSDNYQTEIIHALKEKSLWVKSGTSADDYKNELSVFNEYMTWAVFMLYAYDNYDRELFEEMNESVMSQMKHSRGFIAFPEFNSKMLELYQSKRSNQIEELYPSIIGW